MLLGCCVCLIQLGINDLHLLPNFKYANLLIIPALLPGASQLTLSMGPHNRRVEAALTASPVPDLNLMHH